MNFLAHVYLAGPDVEARLGSLMGDFVKGRLDGRYPPAVRGALRLHRRIDVLTDSHPAVHTAKQLVSAPRRRYAGILVDVFFDHILARDWPHFSAVPLPVFAAGVYHDLAAHLHRLPPRLQYIVPYMQAQDWLTSYRERPAIAQALNGISRRLTRPNPVAGGIEELDRHYGQWGSLFHEFFPELQARVAAEQEAIRAEHA